MFVLRFLIRPVVILFRWYDAIEDEDFEVTGGKSAQMHPYDDSHA